MAHKYTDYPIGECPRCHLTKRLTNNRALPEGKICSNCHKKERPPKQVKCATCGFMGRPARRVPGGVECDGCYKKVYNLTRPLETCDNCGKLRVLHNAYPPLCFECYKELVWEPKLQTCGECKQLKVIVTHSHVGKPLCNTCRQHEYEAPCQTCSTCGRLRPVAQYNNEGEPICKDCYNAKRYAQ